MRTLEIACRRQVPEPAVRGKKEKRARPELEKTSTLEVWNRRSPTPAEEAGGAQRKHRTFEIAGTRAHSHSPRLNTSGRPKREVREEGELSRQSRRSTATRNAVRRKSDPR
jgi:hypothetical protein